MESLNSLHTHLKNLHHQARRLTSTTKANLMFSLGGLALRGIGKRVSNNKRVSFFADHIFENPTSKERSFGTVLICIGLMGLPDDVRVVCISKLARESNRQESEVIKEMQEPGCLLFDEKVFSLLIDRLIDDVRDGRLRLPISRETLSQVMMSSKLSR